MRVIDLTMPLSPDTPVFPGYPSPIVHKWLCRCEDGGFYANLLVLVEHTGTHVDAPIHYVEGGASIDEVPLERFMGPGVVVDFRGAGDGYVIGAEELKGKLEEAGAWPPRGMVVLILTGYSEYAGTPRWLLHPSLGEDAARLLVDAGARAVGIDAPSIDREPYPAHRLLLGAGVPIYENLVNLDKLVGLKFKFIGLPLRIVGGSGSPVRAIAIIED